MARKLMRVTGIVLLSFVLSGLPAVAEVSPATDPVPVTVERKGVVTMYRLPRPEYLPLGVAPDREGRVWVTFETSDQGGAAGEPAGVDPKRVGLLDPEKGTVAYLPAPLNPFLPRVAPDGAVWLTETSAGGGRSAPAAPARLARRDPTSGEWKVFTTPEKSRSTAMVAFDSAGNAWFSELETARVGRVDPRTGAVKEFALPPGSLSLGISVDKDGKVWTTGTVLGSEGGAIGKALRLDPDKGTVDAFPITRGYFATDLATDPKRGVWVTGLGRTLVALLDPGTGKIQWWDTRTTEADRTTVRAKGIVLDRRGEVWGTEPEVDEVSRIIPEKHMVMEYAVPARDAGAQWLAADDRGNIWFAAPGGQAVGRIAADAPVWTLDPGWQALGISAGDQVRGKLRVTNEGKGEARMDLSTLDLPEGVTVSFQRTTVTVGTGKSAEVPFTLKVGAETRDGRYPIRFVAKGNGLAASRSNDIEVVPAGSLPSGGKGGAPSLVAVGAGLVAGAVLVAFLLRLGSARRRK